MIPTPAKINLALHVGPQRRDGYHPVDTLCVFLDAGDRLGMGRVGSSFSLEISGPYAEALTGTGANDNLVLRAARLLVDTGDLESVHFVLEKKVPPASGIGGGTANGAGAMALLLQQKPGFSVQKALELAQGIGADGPVCLAPHLMRGRCFRARGMGEQISPGPVLPPLFLCLANPGVAVPTGQVFSAFDAGPVTAALEIDMRAAFTSLDQLTAWLGRMRNDLRAPAIELVPQIAAVESAMAARPGCAFARMSGSGATVFGLFASQAAAKRAAHWFHGHRAWAVAGPVVDGPLTISPQVAR